MSSKKKVLYIDCGMGAAGDMLTAALLEIACCTEDASSGSFGRPDRDKMEDFIRRFRSVGIPGVEMQAVNAEKNGITGTHVRILVNGTEESTEDHHPDAGHDHSHEHLHMHENDHDHAQDTDGHDHVHRSMKDIETLAAGLNLSEKIRADILDVYRRIAEAEGAVHGRPAGEVHFHEVGALDAVADITAVCMLMREIDPDEIVVSPVATGYGYVKCAHGILPVPAPATAMLLQGIPSYAGDEEGELCTPTGAALTGHFADRFSRMPVMKIQAVGYGIGTKDFKKANCLRIFLGETEEDADGGDLAEEMTDVISELSCNIDDMTGEEIGFAMEKLFGAGALDVYTAPIQMKKNRPGIKLSVLCREENKQILIRTIFRYTTTIGIRETVMNRYILKRREEELDAGGMKIRKKHVSGYGVDRCKPEYEDLAALAEERNCSLREAAAFAEHSDP